MTPKARQIIHEVAARHRLAPELILGRVRAYRLIQARIEIAILLYAQNYTPSQIGRVLGRERTTITFYLGRRKIAPARPRWHRPKIKTLWRKLKKRETRVVPAPAKRKLYLVPYAGAYMPEYEWKERRA